METLSEAIDILAQRFLGRNWRFLKVPEESLTEKVFAWPGGEHEEIMICIYKSTQKDPNIHELFHRQDFSFLILHIREIITH